MGNAPGSRRFEAARWLLAVSYGLGAPVTAVAEFQNQALSLLINHHPYMSLDREGAETAVGDLECLADLAHSLPFADPSRVGLIDRSWGAVPAVLYAACNEGVDAVVSLDGTISYNVDQLRDGQILSVSTGGELVRDPIFVAVGEARLDGATPIDRVTFFEQVTQVDTYLAS